MDKPRILIVDDTAENIDVLSEVLSEYRCMVALNGEKALRIVNTSHLRPDLILLDIMMPGIDGFEVIRRLKAQEETRHIPVIFLSAKNQVEDEARGFSLGAVDYITKPFNPVIVKVRVQTHLELKRSREQLERQNKTLRDTAQLREDVEHITRHDLKNPLSVILGSAQLLSMGRHLNEKQLKRIKLIEAAAYRMLSMINRSLDLVKMERGLYKCAFTDVDAIETIRRIFLEHEKQFRAKGVDLQIIVNGEVLSIDTQAVFHVSGEDLLYYSMLSNLIVNALHASAEHAVVRVYLDQATDTRIRIHNTGVVPVAIRSRFFDKYVTSGKGKAGTGLGTYSARLIAENMNGTIHMESKEGEGTSITLSFPRAHVTSLVA